LHPAAAENVKMGEVVFNVRQRLESIVLKKNATLAEPASWPEAKGVNFWLEVVWWNLLANALQHGKGLIELGWQEGKAELRFWVCDNGEGVPAEKRDKLFQPFHTLYEANASQGLGLSIVQRLMELQGGNCGYEPRLDGGSCFYFTLPVP
jgi:signal transduction histidine kinase